MANLTQEQRLNCMTLAGINIDQNSYIKNYRGNIMNVALNRPHLFPTLTKFRGSHDSPECRAELKRLFGFANGDNPDWLLFVRACYDIEEFASKPNSLWSRIKLLGFGVDP